MDGVLYGASVGAMTLRPQGAPRGPGVSVEMVQCTRATTAIASSL